MCKSKFVNSSGNLNTAKRLLRNNAIIKTHGRHEDIRTLRNADELAQKTFATSDVDKLIVEKLLNIKNLQEFQHGHELVLTCKVFRSQQSLKILAVCFN